MASLDHEQVEPLLEALKDAFPKRDQLDMMLNLKLRKSLESIAPDGTLEVQIFRLIQTAQSDGWTTDLVGAARQTKPGNEKLRIFAEGAGLATPTVSAQTAPSIPPSPLDVGLELPSEELEAVIKKAYDFLEVEWWAAQFTTIKKQVCRITFPVSTPKGPRQSFGTGFLVGPDILLTNYHVVEPIIYGEQGKLTDRGRSARAKDVKLTFDYKLLADRQTTNPGENVTLNAEAWLVDHSPFSALDYALLRLAKPVGNERGWISLFDTPLLEAGMALFIVQHPDGRPLQLALDTVMDWKERADRVRYTTNTEGGSSGSPCFTAKWELVALHHASEKSDNPTYNQGIPIAAIVQRWKEKKLWESLFQHLPTPPVQVEKLDTPASASSQTSSQPPVVDMQALIAKLDRHKLLNLLLALSEDEFHRLLFEFKAIQPHHLGGDNIGRKTLELVLWAERHSQFPKLIEIAYRLFPPPRLDWSVED